MVEALAQGGEIVMTEETYHGDGVESLLEGRDIRIEQAVVKGVAGTVPVHRVRVAPDAPTLAPLASSPAAG